jgi:hypothetical protein
MMVELTAWVAALQLAQTTLPPAPAEKPKAETPNSVDELVITAPAAKPGPKLNLDIKGDFAAREIPYLRQRPTKGCKIMAGGDAGPMGNQGAATGVVCVKRF